jgi:hypothetical protein
MTDNNISIKDFSEQNGLRRQSVFKVVKRLGIETIKARGGADNRGQTISYLTEKDASRVLEEINTRRTVLGDDGALQSNNETSCYEVGVFYLLRLEPGHDPNRFKVGFASNLSERLRQIKCSAPLTKVVRTWPCKRLWEKTAIDSVTINCERIHTEVFRTDSINQVEERCDKFFALMPKLARPTG